LSIGLIIITILLCKHKSNTTSKFRDEARSVNTTGNPSFEDPRAVNEGTIFYQDLPPATFLSNNDWHNEQLRADLDGGFNCQQNDDYLDVQPDEN